MAAAPAPAAVPAHHRAVRLKKCAEAASEVAPAAHITAHRRARPPMEEVHAAADMAVEEVPSAVAEAAHTVAAEAAADINGKTQTQ